MIRDGRQNTGIRDDTYKQFLNISPTKPKNELILDFENAKHRLNEAKAGATVIDTTEVSAAALDVNGDGSINNKDLNRLMKYLIDDSVEICETKE